MNIVNQEPREHTLAEVGRILGLSHQQVRRVQNNALRKLRKALATIIADELAMCPAPPGRSLSPFDRILEVERGDSRYFEHQLATQQIGRD